MLSYDVHIVEVMDENYFDFKYVPRRKVNMENKATEMKCMKL